MQGHAQGIRSGDHVRTKREAQMEEYDLIEETVSILKEIPGGREVIEWFDGWPSFGDGEVLEIRLVRKGPSYFRIAALASEAGKRKGPPYKHAVFNFTLRDMVDLCLDGFAHQNVIGQLNLRRAQDQAVHSSLQGIGLVCGEVEIELEPCAGPIGTIRCNIEKITITPADDYQEADDIG
jgi:hypothetical protein